MPLVEPVTSETLPASGLAHLGVLRLDLDVHGKPFPAIVGVRRPAICRTGADLRKCPLASETIGRALSRFGCHCGPRSARLSIRRDRGSTIMEMHQVRYFLAVTRTLNFTRAADECNVTQPSLTRAIKQLEAELGGDLFRRERPAAQLTELGQRMHPLLQQCYDAASGARMLAASFKGGEVGALRIALTHSIDLVAADSASRPDQAAVQPARIPLPARQRQRGRRIPEEGRSRTRHRRRNRRGLGPARYLAAVHREFPARRQQAASAGGPRHHRRRRSAGRAIAVAKLLRTFGSGERLAARARARRRSQPRNLLGARPDRTARSRYRHRRRPRHRRRSRRR